MANKPKPLVPKKQRRRADKKAEKVVQTIGGKKNRQPLKPVKPKAPKEMIPDFGLARRIMAHATCVANDLSKGDTFQVFMVQPAVLLPGCTTEEISNWHVFEEEEVEFKGIDENGHIVIASLSDTNEEFGIPLEAVNFGSVDNSLRHVERDVELNEEYTASISTRTLDKITVGCQEIPVSAVRELVQVIEELNEAVIDRQRLLDKNKPVAGVYPHLVWNKE